MGILIDTEKVDENPRCKNVKVSIIYINIIGASISLFLLLFASFRMYLAKKKLSFLTLIILLIFSSEIINTISKLLQLVKYSFNDRRNHKDFESGNTPRGIICQIQIVTAIYSDFCSLLGTLLLSLRCYDVIKNKKSFFDKGKNANLSIIFIIVISIILSVGFLYLDKIYDKERIEDGAVEGIGYRYDIRDRCSYWCWLKHDISLICFALFWIIIILNIYFALKIYCHLQKGYKKLLDENDLYSEKINTPLNEVSKDNNNSKSRESNKEKTLNNLTKIEKMRIEELRIMKNKCLVYPLVTIILWTIIATYRIVDDFKFRKIDSGNFNDTKKEESDLFEDKFQHFLVQFFLVLHTILSATRGIFYGFSFLVFEEKLFFNFFRNYCFCFKKKEFEENEEEKKEIVRNTYSSSETNDYMKEEANENQDDESKNEVIEMNNSDYNY